MAFISSSNISSGKREVPTVQGVPLLTLMLFWKKSGKKITIQGSDVAGFEKLKVECFNCHKMGHFTREFRAPRSQDIGRKESYKKDPKVEEPAHKAMMAIDGVR
ncbi:ribonuclease H-like domain-containing protein [Tanacetum coccineum]